ncbi:hypothetical protein BGZ83_008509 [Gryganskiella cystojenkinii]|nr:hypothetical protein BGZ83_008509 [Gryganskiella cystojenkinii]
MGRRISSPFKVLIVGAGVGGLMMALCLERAGIDYVVLERLAQLPPPKSTIQLSAKTLRAIEQLGLLEEVLKIAKPVSTLRLKKQDMSTIGKMDTTFYKERYGHYSCIALRTEFCQMLISRLPRGKIQWSKYVLEIVTGNAGVQCRCANGHVEQADVLVGADGPYSAVRQNLYRRLKEKGVFLPKSDTEALKFVQNCIMGLTAPIQDLDRYPAAAAEFAEVFIVVGKDQPYTLWLSPTTGNRVAWSVSGKLLTPSGSSELSENFKQSEFGPEAVDAVCALIQDLPIPWGGTLADLIELTPRECLTKLMVEEKFVPFSGQGAEQAILDVICLVNMLYRLPTHASHEDFCGVFKSYYDQRSPIAKNAVQTSHLFSHVMNSQGITADMKRKIIFNLPAWITNSAEDKIQTRPLLEFLPSVPDRGAKPPKTVAV